MRTNIKLELTRNNKRITSLSSSIDIQDGMNIFNLKLKCREFFKGIPQDEIYQEIITRDYVEFDDSDLVPNKKGLTYTLFLLDSGSKDPLGSDYKLGRTYSSDKRDRSYLIINLLRNRPKPPTQQTQITSRYWEADKWWGNQGRTSQCVGFSWAHWLNDGPVLQSPPYPSVNPTLIYTEAQKIDEWPGENYEGTSVRAGAKYLQSIGKISNYYWTKDVNTLASTVLNLGPVVVGTSWYSGMYFPDRNGLIRRIGRLLGGHAYLINGVDMTKRLFRIKNSWGRTWGLSGHAFISFSDMALLLKEYSEVCLATEIPS